MLAIIMASCGHHVYSVSSSSDTGAAVAPSNQVRIQPTGGPVSNPNGPGAKTGVPADFIQPNATAFRMSGDYYDNVAITLAPNGEILYFPAPTDITADSKPIDLGNGWWLNNQGFGPNSVFTKYTFAQYAELPEAPSPSQLKLDIIPGAKVTKFIELPMKLDDAYSNLDAVKDYLKNQ